MSERRRQYYTDQKLQGYLLVVLISVQLVLVSVLLYFLHGDINALIEENIYRVHSKEASSWPDIFRLLAITMSMFLLINIFLLYLAHTAWSRYIKGTISQFSSILDRIVNRDFKDPPLSLESGHQMMQLAQQWWSKEQLRRRDMDTLLQQLSEYKNKNIQQNELMQMQKVLQDYRQLLISN